MYPKSGNVPYVSKKVMAEVDRLMIKEYQINLFQMMENAGRNMAVFIRDLISRHRLKSPMIAVMAGSGGNGGGVITAARRLHLWGFDVTVALSKPPEDIKGVPGIQLDILKKINVPAEEFIKLDIKNPRIIIDGILGYSISGDPAGTAKNMINFINSSRGIKVSLDIPSGIDPDRGIIYTPYVKPDFTLTLALPKKAFLLPEVNRILGKIYLCDISVPPCLFEKYFNFLDTGYIFDNSEIVEID